MDLMTLLLFFLNIFMVISSGTTSIMSTTTKATTTTTSTTTTTTNNNNNNNNNPPIKNIKTNLVCSPGMLTMGATFPKGDIYLQEGDSLDANCTLNLTKPELKNINAEHIIFSLSRLGKQSIPNELMKTTVLNNSTAVFHVDNMNASKPVLSCYVKKPDGGQMLICRNEVDVGYLPKEVENFRCIAKNWASLNCSWNKPYNPILTDYKLMNIITKGYRMNCPLVDSYNGTESCEWTGRSEPHYHQNIDTLRLEMNGTNKLSPNGITWSYRIDHWKIVVPDKPDKIVATPVSPLEINVTWSFYIFEYFKAGLVHKVTICTVEGIEVCKVHEFKSERVPQFNVSVQVPYAFTQYSVEIRMKSQRAENTEEFWSRPSSVLVKTLPKKPENPPETTIGSFEVVNKYQARDIYIYWKYLAQNLQNGSDFHRKFKVFENDQLQTDVEPSEINGSYAVFSSMSLESHRFEITSINSEGMSPHSSVIFLPSTIDAPKPPVSVSKLVFANGTFEVSWRHSPLGNSVDSYTVYICNSSRDLPDQCHVLLEWVEVDGSETGLIIRHLNPHGTIYQFAVSANSNNMSSGMVSASCEQIYNKVPPKITYVQAENMISDSINIKWKLDCSFSAVMVQKFRITYCPVIDFPRYSCSGEEQDIFAQANASEYKLEKLKPFTKYMITISIVSKEVESQMSDPLFASTTESAPSDSPRVRSIEEEKTNTTALIMIEPPQELNGIIRVYNIIYKSTEMIQSYNKSIDKKDLLSRDDGLYYYNLTNLESNENYTVTVSACTVSCSNVSEPIYIKTRIGYTNLKQNPILAYDDGTFLVSWKSPDHLGGPIDHFEVSVKKNGELYSTEEPLVVKYIPGDLDYNEKVNLECESNTNVTVQIRAVTKIQGEYLYGNWSPEGIFNCFGGSLLIVWIFAAAGGLFLIILLASTTFFSRFRSMTKFDVKLPPGIRHFQQLNGHSNGQTGRQNLGGNIDTVSYGKDNLTYPMQLTSTQPDETKDFLSSESCIKETGQMDHQQQTLPNCTTDGNENLNLDVNDESFNFEDGKVPLWLWQPTKLTTNGENNEEEEDDILKRNTSMSQILPTIPCQNTMSPSLSNHPHPSGDDDQNLPRISPSPSNPLLCDSNQGGGSEEDEYNPEHYKKLGILTNGDGIICDHHSPQERIDPFTVNISIPSSGSIYTNPPKPTHVLTIDTTADPKTHTYVQNVDSLIDGKTVPDILPNNNSSYVKWNAMKNDPNVGSPYCQVGILL